MANEEKPREGKKYRAAKERAMSRMLPRESRREKNELWERILREHEMDRVFWLYDESVSPAANPVWEYLEAEVMPILLPSLWKSCMLEEELEQSGGAGRVFSFPDAFLNFLVTDPAYVGPPGAAIDGGSAKVFRSQYSIPTGGGPDIPKHLIMSRNKAAKTLQKHVRGWLVRKRPDVQELRNFWRLYRESEAPAELHHEKSIHLQADSLVEPAVLSKLFDEQYLRKHESHLTRRMSKAPQSKEPEDACANSLGLHETYIDGLSREERREVLRIASAHPDLRSDALNKFLKQRKIVAFTQ